MRRYICVIFLLLMAWGSMTGRNMQEVWLSMPDSIIPFIDRSHRIEMLDFALMNANATTDNRLQGKSRIDTLTSNFMKVELTESSNLQIKLLPTAGGDTLICMIHSYKSDAIESVICFFNTDWKKAAVDLPHFTLPERPDTMDVSTYSQLLTSLEPHISHAELNPSDNSLKQEWSLPLLSKEERKQMKSLCLLHIWHWNGTRFE